MRNYILFEENYSIDWFRIVKKATQIFVVISLLFPRELVVWQTSPLLLQSMCTKLLSAKHLIGFGMATFFRCKITIDHEILFAGQRSLLIFIPAVSKRDAGNYGDMRTCFLYILKEFYSFTSKFPFVCLYVLENFPGICIPPRFWTFRWPCSK